MTNEIGIKRVEPRYIIMNEDIYEALDVYERSVYEALRYEADYSKESSIVKRSIAFIVNKSKVSRRQVFRCLSSLETTHYLIKRIESSVTGVQNNYNVSRTLNFFNPIATSASYAPTSASQALDDIFCTEKQVTSASQALPSASQALLISNSFNNRSTTSELRPPAAIFFGSNPQNPTPPPAPPSAPPSNCQTPIYQTPNPSYQEPEQLTPSDLIQIYKEEFPNNPHPIKNPITKDYFPSLIKLIKNFKIAWKEDNETELTPETFRRYLVFLQKQAPKFALGEYKHPNSEKITRNGLPTFINVEHYVKFFNGEYS